MTDCNNFDIFLSYNWDSKGVVRSLYDKLTVNLGYKVWIDDDQLDSGMLYEQLCQGIKNSKVVLCCVTQKYADSENCIKEITFAQTCKKPLVILMLERLNISEIGCVGFIIASLTRFNFYKETNIQWRGEVFDSMMKSVKAHLNGNNNANIKKLIQTLKVTNVLRKSFDRTLSTEESSNSIATSENREVVANNPSEEAETIESDRARNILDFGFGYYQGDIVDERMEGYGTFYYDNNDKYEGYWHADKKDGKGTFFYYDGEKYEGDFVSNQKEGLGKYYFKSGDVYTGQFNENRINGKGEFLHKNGDTFTGYFKSGKKHGPGEYVFKDGDRIAGNWIEGQQTGQGVYNYVNGDRYEGEFLNGRSHGHGVFTFASGEKYVGDYCNGMRHGKGIYYFNDGGKYEGSWANNKKSGFGRLQFTDKEWYEGQFADGLFDGDGTYHYESGNEYQGKWSKGIKASRRQV